MVDVWKKKNLNVRTYRPEDKLGLRKEHTIPILNYIGMKLAGFGGVMSVFIHGFFAGLSGFYRTKSKIRESQMKKEKVLDLRVKIN